MTSIPIPFYRCERCRREFDSREEAENCERGHLKPVSVQAKQYTIRPHLYSVEVTFENGEKRIYNADDLGG
jgi:hypothetical protein